jgi:hypothetical protein
MAENVVAQIDMLIIVIVVEPADHHQVVAPIWNRSLTLQPVAPPPEATTRRQAATAQP